MHFLKLLALAPLLVSAFEVETGDDSVQKRALIIDGTCDVENQTCLLRSPSLPEDKEMKCVRSTCKVQGGECFSHFPYKRGICRGYFEDIFSRDGDVETREDSIEKRRYVLTGKCDVEKQTCRLTSGFGGDKETKCYRSTCKVQGGKCYAHWPYKHGICHPRPFSDEIPRGDAEARLPAESVEKRSSKEDGTCDIYKQKCLIMDGRKHVSCDDWGCRTQGGPCYSVWPFKQATCNPVDKIEQYERDVDSETDSGTSKRDIFESGTCKVDTQMCLVDGKHIGCEDAKCRKDGDHCKTHWPHKHAKCSVSKGLLDRDSEHSSRDVVEDAAVPPRIPAKYGHCHKASQTCQFQDGKEILCDHKNECLEDNKLCKSGYPYKAAQCSHNGSNIWERDTSEDLIAADPPVKRQHAYFPEGKCSPETQKCRIFGALNKKGYTDHKCGKKKCLQEGDRCDIGLFNRHAVCQIDDSGYIFRRNQESDAAIADPPTKRWAYGSCSPDTQLCRIYGTFNKKGYKDYKCGKVKCLKEGGSCDVKLFKKLATCQNMWDDIFRRDVESDVTVADPREKEKQQASSHGVESDATVAASSEKREASSRGMCSTDTQSCRVYGLLTATGYRDIKCREKSMCLRDGARCNAGLVSGHAHCQVVWSPLLDGPVKRQLFGGRRRGHCSVEKQSCRFSHLWNAKGYKEVKCHDKSPCKQDGAGCASYMPWKRADCTNFLDEM